MGLKELPVLTENMLREMEKSCLERLSLDSVGMLYAASRRLMSAGYDSRQYIESAITFYAKIESLDKLPK